jgi:FtsH-binding integral membrane protein
MWTNAALFLFLAAGSVSLFAFLSVAVWVGAQAHERKARDRFALLKTLAENPGEHSQRIIDLLRHQEDTAAARKELEEKRGFLIGGLTCVAVGVALSVMIGSLDAKPGVWTVGLIPTAVGVVLAGVGYSMKPRG